MTRFRPKSNHIALKSSPSEIRDQRTEKGKGCSPPPNPLQFEVWSVLRSGIDSLPFNDFGRPWPYPSRAAVARLTAEFDPDLCCKAAREAKEIVQAQDRAPNITALWEKRLRALAEVRGAARESLRGTGDGEDWRVA